MSDESDADILAKLRKEIVCAQNPRGFTALHHSKGLDVLKYLIACGADPNARSDFGSLPVALQTDPACVQYLINMVESNSCMEDYDDNAGESNVHLIFFDFAELLDKPDGLENCFRIVEILKRNNVNINVADLEGKTPLDWFDRRTYYRHPQYRHPYSGIFHNLLVRLGAKNSEPNS